MMHNYHEAITPKTMTQMYDQMVPTNYNYKKDELKNNTTKQQQKYMMNNQRNNKK